MPVNPITTKEEVVKAIHQKVRTRVPDDNKWVKKFVLTARAAIVACSVCRNQVSRGLADLSDQFNGIERIGEGTLEAAMVIVRGPAVRPLTTTQIEVPAGNGKSLQVTVGVNTLIMSETDFGADVLALAQETPADFLARLATQVRNKTSDCCRQQVWDRRLGQSNPRRTIKVHARRTREKHPAL